MKERLETFAEYMGWEVTPDPTLLTSYIERLQKQEDRFGIPICPCVFVDEHNPAYRATIVYDSCPCTRAYEDVETKGQCKCGLFIRKADRGRNPTI